MGFVLSGSHFHFGDEDSTQKDSDALLACLDLRVVTASQTTAVELDTVAGEDKHQHDEQDGDEEDLFEASTELRDDFPHVRHQDEYAEWPEASKQQ